MKFKGDIIITDPCYIDTEDNLLWDDKSGKFDLFTGSGLDNFGFTQWLYGDTVYGDWSCTTYNSDTKEELGHFCADAGLVAVFYLDEVLKFNPKFDYHINNPWTTTLIKDFNGDIDLTTREFSYEDEGEEFYDTEVSVIGKGNINFFTTQTGL